MVKDLEVIKLLGKVLNVSILGAKFSHILAFFTTIFYVPLFGAKFSHILAFFTTFLEITHIAKVVSL
jgi:hypothetical protein